MAISLPRPPRRKGVHEQTVSRSPFLLDQQQQPQLACINHSNNTQPSLFSRGRADTNRRLGEIGLKTQNRE
ncbi:hypothetical protein NC653_031922 [Populus alba x Populus x berolinensis]|uniref:Uncharacterized protein n=1 Tax=Populus alba x Populus x berolinensis TaxID=444605 RepID=A0AAD6Q254_9ROSI|nr:hypothetical protein NC653_031922 [Populus alba x Populus x berolinensis]